MGKKKEVSMDSAKEEVKKKTVKPVKKAEKVEKTTSEVKQTEEKAQEVKKPAAKKTVKTEKAAKAEKIAEKTTEVQDAPETKSIETTKAPRVRGKRFVAARGKIDKTKLYSPKEAVALAKKTNVARFAGSLEAHCVVREAGLNLNVSFPHSTGKTVKAAIVSDEILAELDKGLINFSVLIAHPSMMPKIAKYARLLGPKGLMPNPKNGTVTPDPEKRKAELEGGAIAIKTERKAPLMHIVIGKISQPEAELSANLSALFAAFPPGKLLKCSISATMGPGIKVAIE